jgi:hypothetical protein
LEKENLLAILSRVDGAKAWREIKKKKYNDSTAKMRRIYDTYRDQIRDYITPIYCLCATYIFNRTPTVNNTKIAAWTWYNRKPDFSKLKVFGCEAYLLIPKEIRKSKYEKKSLKLIFVGYNQNGYRLWDSSKNEIIEGRDVRFNKQITRACNVNEPICNIDNIENIIIHDSDESNANVDEPICNIDNIENIIIPDVDRSNANANDRHFLYNVEAFVDDYPNTVRAAKSRNDWPKWEEAINRELRAIEAHNGWELVEKSPETMNNVITSRWVFSIKNNCLYKARLTARGFQQDHVFSFQEIFAPVANLSTVRTLLCVCLQKGYLIDQVDMGNAYLHAKLKNPVFMQIPDGFKINVNDENKYVLKLNRALYGLQQAPKA